MHGKIKYKGLLDSSWVIKFFVACILYVGFFSSTLAQATIKGKIQGEKTLEAYPFVRVLLIQNDSMVNASQSNFDGFYTLSNVSPGTYMIKMQYPGYPELTEEITITKKTTTLVHDFIIDERDPDDIYIDPKLTKKFERWSKHPKQKERYRKRQDAKYLRQKVNYTT